MEVGMKVVGWLILCLVVAVPVAAKTKVSVGGQVRPRFEVRDPAGTGHDVITNMRVRANLKAKLDRDVSAFIQLQDVRLWGEETSTLGDFRADNFDLHQGYIRFGDVGETAIDVTIGRQEMSLGGQRLVGAVGWTQQGRSFDGVRVSDSPKGGKVDLFLMRIGDESATAVSANAYFGGAYVTVPVSGKKTGLDLYTLYNRTSGAADTELYTLGARIAGASGKLTYRGEASYQAGDVGGSDVAAYMAGARLGYKLTDKATLTLWGDLLSGDNDPTDGDIKVFNTLFATNHKFYGFADLFLNVPAHTNGQGLMELAIKLSLKPKKGVSLGVDLHSFRLAEKRALTSSRLGEEVDVTLGYKYSKQASIVVGGSYVFQKDALGAIGRLGEDMKWAYVMTNVAF
jgi:hypothetical protein